MASDDYRPLPTKTTHLVRHRGRITERPGDLNATPRPGGRHRVQIVEQDCPGVFEISCNCGEVTWTPWGQDSAGEIATMHLFSVGETRARVVFR